MSRAIVRDLDGSVLAGARTTICSAAHQVGEIAARDETGQYNTGSGLQAKGRDPSVMNVLLLVHHGAAVGPEVDPMRPLSAVGLAATERLAGLAAQRGVKPDVIWHSGKLRARQTAELFWKACNPFASLTAERGLLPDDRPQWMHDRLTGETRSVLIAGHMPYLPRLLALLTGREAIIPLHGCVALEPDGDRWKEVWRLEA